MFPISDSHKIPGFPFFVISLIVANVYVFFAYLLGASAENFILQYSFIPATFSVADPNTYYQLITSIFLHGGWFHILSNMWFLWIFGDNIELGIGKIKFLLLYFLAGIAGNLAQYLAHPGSEIPIIGASGAISGILGAYFILFPRSQIRSLLLLFFIITTVNIPASIYLFYWFAIQFFSGASTIGATSDVGGVAFWAHVGGFVAGIVLAKLLNPPKKDFIEGKLVD